MSFLLKGLVFLALVLFGLLFLFRSKFKFHVFSFLRRNQFLLFQRFHYALQFSVLGITFAALCSDLADRSHDLVAFESRAGSGGCGRLGCWYRSIRVRIRRVRSI